MADLVVDLGPLESTAGALSMLTEEFSNASRIVTSYQRSVGEPALVAALQSFADDWRVHRQSLLSSMGAVYTMASRSHTAYIATDDKLARDPARFGHPGGLRRPHRARRGGQGGRTPATWPPS